jgi:hypothetical protein
MIDLPAAIRGFSGAWRLAHLDPQGLRYFDNTPEGFSRSFQAAVVAAPLFLLIVVLLPTTYYPLSDDSVRAIAVETIKYAIDWTAFPLCAWYLTQALDKSSRYFAYIAAYNWSKVLQLLAFVPTALLAASGAVPDEITGLITMVITALVVYYQYFIVRHALAIDVLPALGFVSLDLMISILLNLVGTSLQMS